MLGHEYDQMLSTWTLDDGELASPDGRFRLYTHRGWEGFRDVTVYDNRSKRVNLIEHEPVWKRYKLYRAVMRRARSLIAESHKKLLILDIEAGIAPKGQMVEHLLMKGK